MNTVSGACVGVIARRRRVHRRRAARPACARLRRAAAPPPPPPRPPPPPAAPARAATGGSVPSIMRLICASALSILICRSALPTLGRRLRLVVAADAVVLVVVAGAADRLRMCFGVDEQHLRRVEDVGVVADLVRRRRRGTSPPTCSARRAPWCSSRRPSTRVAAPFHSSFSFSAAVRMPVRLPPDSPRKQDRLEAAGLEAAAGVDQQLDEAILRQRDRAGLAHVAAGVLPAALGHVGDDRRDERLAERARDLVGGVVHDELVLAVHHVRALLLGARGADDHRGRARRRSGRAPRPRSALRGTRCRAACRRAPWPARRPGAGPRSRSRKGRAGRASKATRDSSWWKPTPSTAPHKGVPCGF